MDKQGLNYQEMLYARNNIQLANITLLAIVRNGNKQQQDILLKKFVSTLDRKTLLTLQEVVDNELLPEAVV